MTFRMTMIYLIEFITLTLIFHGQVGVVNGKSHTITCSILSKVYVHQYRIPLPTEITSYDNLSTFLFPILRVFVLEKSNL